MWRASLLLVILAAAEARAYKPAPPERRDVFSPNGAFVVDIDPGAERCTVYATQDRTLPLWSFKDWIGLKDYFLSNDGTVVAVIAGRYTMSDRPLDETCIAFWDRTGLFKEYTHGEICPNPISTFMREGPWNEKTRKWYSKATSDGDLLGVTTTENYTYTFRFRDGAIVSKHDTRNVGVWAALTVFAAVIAAIVLLVARAGAAIWNRR